MRLINADAIEYKESRMGTVYQSTDDGFVWREERILEQVSKEDIDKMPIIDAEPVKHGKWERHYSRPNVYADLWWHCSVCGYKNDDQYANCYHHYCPNCGAKMDSNDSNALNALEMDGVNE